MKRNKTMSLYTHQIFYQKTTVVLLSKLAAHLVGKYILRHLATGVFPNTICNLIRSAHNASCSLTRSFDTGSTYHIHFKPSEHHSQESSLSKASVNPTLTLVKIAVGSSMGWYTAIIVWPAWRVTAIACFCRGCCRSPFGRCRNCGHV